MKKNQIYFQKQSALSAQCGLCALNNLIGAEMFNHQNLDKICKQLSTDMINPYKSIFGGDYDVSVIIKALQTLEFPVRWLKKDQKISQVLSNDLLKGILINTEQKQNVFFKRLIGRSGRHWTCIRKIYSNYILLDSIKQEPKIFDKGYTTRTLQQIREGGGTILLVQLQIVKNKDTQQSK